MMTAHIGITTMRIQALDAGATAVLSKPFDLDHHTVDQLDEALKNGHPSILVPSQAFVSG